ncbi:MAG: hypothetical protein HYY84_04760 [Deltaproteobacteria bacterium]|nr:hypothetical protein [Deltaproteobacteria bacterium]
MDTLAAIDTARLRKKTRTEIARLLARLASVDRCAVLSDLLVEEETPPTMPSVAAPALATPLAPQSAKRGRPPKPKVVTAEADSVDGPTGAKMGRTDTLLAVLRTRPGMPIRELAAEVYGDDDKLNQNKTRSLLASLKKNTKVKNSGVGHWEVVS